MAGKSGRDRVCGGSELHQAPRLRRKSQEAFQEILVAASVVLHCFYIDNCPLPVRRFVCSTNVAARANGYRIYVAFPRISQNDINDSTLTISSLILSNPKPDSFHLVQTSVIGNGSPYHPNLDAFNASLSLDGSGPYAYVEIPQVHATKQATSIIDQDVSITDLAAFTDYNIAVLGSETVKVDVRGRTALHEMKFPDTTVNYEKTVSMKGTHYGLSIMDAALIDPPRLEQTQRFQRHRVLHRTNARARRHQHDRHSLHPQSHRHDHRHGSSPILFHKAPLTSPPRAT